MFEDVKAIQKSNQKFAIILNELKSSGEFKNTNDAFVVLRATLKALRDRIDPGEAVHLGGQLPALLRGFYYEEFEYSTEQKPKSYSRDAGDFLAEVRYHLHGHDDIRLTSAVPVALKTILSTIDEGEARQVVHGLPKEIQVLCDDHPSVNQ